MKRILVAAAALAASLTLAGPAATDDFDHPAPAFTAAAPPGPSALMSPAGAWEFVATVPTGNPHTDIDFFKQGGEIYVAAGTLAAGANGGGQTIVKLTDGGEVTASSVEFVSAHPSASCVSRPDRALGLQHDVEATPKGRGIILNTKFPRGVKPATTDAQLILDATDHRGRCHDSTFGTGTDPLGGLEIVDITDVTTPKELGLTSHIGEAHTVNVDPKRPHIAFAVTSDAVTIPSGNCNADDTDCKRADEDANPDTNQGIALDGFELVDLRSCMNFPKLTSLDAKRMVCRPDVYRYRWESALTAMGHTQDRLSGCHELEIYPNDLLTCAAIDATLVFDMSGAFDDNGTPDDYRDDTPRGTPLPCRVRDTMSPPPYTTGAKITDCVNTDTDAENELTIEGWKALGSPSLEGVQFVGAAYHQGRGGPNDSTQDIDVSHEAELTKSGKFLLATDERGGGVSPPGATCLTSPADNPSGNGGTHAYRVDKLLTQTPSGPNNTARDQAWTSYARTPTGEKAIYRAPIMTDPQPTLCTSHVFHQIPGQNRIFMGYYTQGTQVVDFVERPDGTFKFTKIGHFIPANANTWVSAIFKFKRNPDGTWTYWGATGDFNLGEKGRSAIDIYKVTLPKQSTR